MTIQSESIKAGPFDGNDSTTVFPFTFKVFQAADLGVILTDISEIESTLVLDTDYSVSLNADQEASPGGSVTYPIAGDPLATGEKLTILNALEFTQGTDLQNGGAWNPETVENAMDRLTMLAQRLDEENDRGLRVPVSDDVTGLTIPSKANRVSKFLAFDTDGEPMASEGSGTPTSAFMATVNDDESAAEACNTLSATHYVTTVAAMKALSLPAGQRVQTQGYYTAGDGGGATYLTVAPQAFDGYGDHELANGNIAVLQTNGALNVLQFGAYKNGTNETSANIQAAIDRAAAIVLSLSAPSNTEIVTASVFIPSGEYVITTAIELKSGVRVIGESTLSTSIAVNAAINGFVSLNGSTYNSTSVQGLTIRNKSATALIAFDLYGMIRNCSLRDVHIWDFTEGVKFTDTWTFVLRDMLVNNSTNHAAWVSAGCGEIIIEGGRYDGAGDHIIYVDNLSTVAELTMKSVAAQFGSKSSVYVDGGCRTVHLVGCFFEGSCIGNPAHYYVELYGSGASLSNALVDKCVINDLSDANRHGDGAIYFQDFYQVKFVDRWTRNATQSMPIIGTGVYNTDFDQIGTSADVSTTELPNVGGSNANFAKINQIARPFQYIGIDMKSAGYSLPTKATATFSSNADGNLLAVGTYNGTPAVQSNTSLLLNPELGDVQLPWDNLYQTLIGGLRYKITATSSNITTDGSTNITLTNTSGGNRGVVLASADAESGRIILCKKSTGDANSLTISTEGAETIDGAATKVTTTAYGHIVVFSDGANWFTLSVV